jgi:integrase
MMPSGAAVIRYDGKRGVVWRVKYADATGKQVMETLGREADGWTEVKAQRELGKRLHDVDNGWRKPPPLLFSTYAPRWFEEGETRRRWAPSTVLEYRPIRRRLVGYFGRMPLAAVRPADIAAYVTELSKSHGPAVVVRDIALLHAIYKTAKAEEIVPDNPAEGVERPRLPRRRWRILEPAEVVSVAAAFTDDRLRAAFLTLVITGLRRHELLNLRWADVDLLDGVLRVRKSKTEAGERAIALPPRLRLVLEALFDRPRTRRRPTSYSRTRSGEAGSTLTRSRRRSRLPLPRWASPSVSARSMTSVTRA